MSELKAITPRAFERIRDQIGSILATELPKQAILLSDTRIDAEVYVERFVPIGDEEAPIVTVGLSDGNFGLETSDTVDGEFTFFIDCYEKAKATSTDDADSRASYRLQRLAGVIHGILSDSSFRVLKFEKPFIENTTIKSIKIADPRNSKDASSVVMARIEFIVRAPDAKQESDPVTIAGYSTQAVLGLTDKGYTYGGDSLPPVDPICEPAEVKNSDDTYIQSVDSGGVLVLEDVTYIINIDGVEVSRETVPSQVDNTITINWI